jgi:hypothetical protein
LDDVLISALIGTAATGQTGSGSQALPSGQKIAHSSAVFTPAKVDQGIRLLQEAEVDTVGTELFLALSPDAAYDLIQDSSNRVVSADFQENRVLAGRNLPKYRGINIIMTNRIPVISAGVFRALLFTRDAVKLAIGKDLEIKTAERPDLNFALQLSTYMAAGAVRMEDEQVVEIAFQ